MRICVFGAGAVGGYLAAKLGEAGKSISIVARGSHLDAIRRNGLCYQVGAERRRIEIPAVSNPAELGPQDLIIVTAKTTALREIAPIIGPLLTKDTIIAFASNGVFWFYSDGPPQMEVDTSRLDPEGFIHSYISPERCGGIVVHAQTHIPDPGMIVAKRRGRFVVGPAVNGFESVANSIGTALANCDFDVEVTNDVRLAMWRKLVRSAVSSPLCCLVGGTAASAFSDPDVRQVGERLMHEVVAVAAAIGYSDLAIDIEKDCLDLSRAPVKPSMLHDLERRRPMEIDAQLSIVQDFARQAGVTTPLLDASTALLIARARAAGCYR